MTKPALIPSAFLAAAFLVPPLIPAQALAPTPPMGWNSWDAYGLTIDEDQFKANATVLASIQQYGWKYAVIDEGWYMANPAGRTLEEKNYLWDANGLLIPVSTRFPSAANGAGFKPIADWLHAQGLKFGIHIVRGIPRQVVAANLPIAGSPFHAADAADTTSPCPWDAGNWGIKDNAAGQAYYDSIIRLYASWGLDFLKVDCVSDHPYRPTEIRQIAEAIRKSGRPIVLSLSPGPTQLGHAAEVQKYAQMWRIADDHWDGWTFPRQPDTEFPMGCPRHVRSPRAVVRLHQPRQLARRRHAPRRLARPQSRLGRSASIPPDARRATHRIHSLGHHTLTAHLWRQPHQTRRLHALASHQSIRAFCGPVRHIQPSRRPLRSRTRL